MVARWVRVAVYAVHFGLRDEGHPEEGLVFAVDLLFDLDPVRLDLSLALDDSVSVIVVREDETLILHIFKDDRVVRGRC